MTNKQQIVWSGSDNNGYVGNVSGIALYNIRTVPTPPVYPGQKSPKYLFLTQRLNTRGYEPFDGASRANTVNEAKTQCAVDFTRNGGRAALHKTLGHALLIVEALGFHVSKLKTPRPGETLDNALAIVRAAGYRIRKPKVPKPKGRLGPVFACEFSDGSRVRLSVACSTETLDWDRGENLARQAWASRQKMPLDLDSAELAKLVPPIITGRFEQNGVVLAQRNRSMP